MFLKAIGVERRRHQRKAVLIYVFEVRRLHEYLEVLARLKGAPLRAFGEESAALRWLATREAASQP